MIRLTFVLRRKPEMSRAEFQEYWRNVHGPLVAKSSTALNMLRYVQVHTLDDPINDQLAEARGGMEEPYDGVAEVWWPNREALTSGLDNAAGRAAAKELVEDEARFIDLAHSPLWFNYEYPAGQPHTGGNSGAGIQPLGERFSFVCAIPSISASNRPSSTGAPTTAR